MSVTANATMAGKLVLITGATSGIGYVTARELARQGARVVLVSRSAEKLAQTAAEITRETNNAAIETLTADLSSQADIRRLSDEIHQRYPHIDVLVNNAGAVYLGRSESVDGIEMTFALNHLGYFLLTNLLLDIMKASAPSRIVNVSSDAHAMVTFDFDDIEGKKHYNGLKAYGRSKLANLWFTFELARRLEGTGVTVNALHPGFVRTNFFAGNGGLGAFMRLMVQLFGTPAEKAARTSIYLASSPEVEGTSGKFFVKSKLFKPSKASQDEKAQKSLWETSEKMTGMVPVS